MNSLQKFLDVREKSYYLKSNLSELGLEVVSKGIESLPTLLTIGLPKHLSSYQLGDYLESMGLLINYMSNYYLERNWIQISLMGGCTLGMIDKLMAELKKYCFYHEKVC
jgi:aspartate aminotransferase-like enzyme